MTTFERVRAWVSERPVVTDGLLAAVLLVVTLTSLWQVPPDVAQLERWDGPDALAVGLVVAVTAPLAWRRRAPLTVLGVISVAAMLAAVVDVPLQGYGLLLGLYSAALYGPRVRALGALLLLTGGMIAVLVAIDLTRYIGMNLLVLVVAYLLGDWRRQQWARAAALERRTEELEHARAERARLAVAEERQRIASELRDVLAHSVTGMVTQARAAGRLLERAPQRATEALAAVERTGRGGLLELRRLVGLLREEDAAPAPQRAASPVAQISDERATALLDRIRARVRAGPVLAQDLALGAALVVVEVSLQWAFVPGDLGLDIEQFGGPTPGSILLVSLMCLTLGWRRRYPQLVMVLCLAFAAALVLLAVPAQLYAPLVALYTVAGHCHRRASLAWLGASAVLVAVLAAATGGLAFLPQQLIMLVVVWLLGDRQRVRRDEERDLEARADELHEAREREVALAVADERGRIARELHDVVAHSIGVMVVQAGGARRFAERDPARAADAIEQIITCGRDSLTRLRSVLDVLGDQHVDFAPQPSLADLEDLLADYREAGLSVSFEVHGEPRAVTAGVALSAFRIVQESLTNVLKHAGTAEALVVLRYDEQAISIEVSDDGRGPSTGAVSDTGGGHGLVGMRERAALVGGTLTLGSRPGGGFRVQALLPTQERAAPAAVDEAGSAPAHEPLPAT